MEVDMESLKYILLKALVYLGIFILLHYIYHWFPNEITAIISGINESVYQHLKLSLYAFLIITVIEFLVFRRKIVVRNSYLFSRLFSLVFIPWVTFILFFFTRVLYPLQFSDFWEIIAAQVSTYIAGVIVCLVEIEFNKNKFNKNTKIVILILLVLLVVEFTYFTFTQLYGLSIPWHDVFANPYGP